MSKLFTKVINNHRKAAGYSTSERQSRLSKWILSTDHLQVITQLVQKADEYDLPLCFAFVDYEKAFDSVAHWH